MNILSILKIGCTALLYGALASTGSALAAPLVVDDFSSPGLAVTGTPTGSGAQFFERSFDTFAGVAGQVREANYNLYSDPSSSGAQVSIGGGSASVYAGKAALGEYIFSYGAFTRPTGDPAIGGPFLNLDLRGFNNFQVEFGAVIHSLNINVVLYTSVPLLLPDGRPLYYLQSGINIGPATPGGPMTADLFLNGLNPLAASFAPYFNFSKVDGIVLLIDRSGFATGNAYSLDRLSFAQTVPEPSTWALMLAGLAAIGGLSRRSRR